MELITPHFLTGAGGDHGQSSGPMSLVSSWSQLDSLSSGANRLDQVTDMVVEEEMLPCESEVTKDTAPDSDDIICDTTQETNTDNVAPDCCDKENVSPDEDEEEEEDKEQDPKPGKKKNKKRRKHAKKKPKEPSVEGVEVISEVTVSS